MTEAPETTTNPTLVERMRLDVDRRWLFAIAGVIWTGVGILLLGYAATWLVPVAPRLEIELVLAGLGVAVIFIRFVFHGIVRKNIARIEEGPQRVSAFSFQGWKSYVITVLMIAIGVSLRHSAVPKPALAVIYLGVGLGLLLTSLLYHRHLFRVHRGRS